MKREPRLLTEEDLPLFATPREVVSLAVALARWAGDSPYKLIYDRPLVESIPGKSGVLIREAKVPGAFLHRWTAEVHLWKAYEETMKYYRDRIII